MSPRITQYQIAMPVASARAMARRIEAAVVPMSTHPIHG